MKPFFDTGMKVWKQFMTVSESMPGRAVQHYFPIFKWWIHLLARDILENMLRGSAFRILGVNNLAAFIKLQNIGINGINLLQSAWLMKNAGIINLF